MEGASKMASDLKDRSDELIVEKDPKSPASEAYRTLRTNISYLSPDDPLTKIAISSSGPSEGKSLTVANLAVAMAQNERDVIVIDCDIRKPMQHRFYGLSNFEGLSNLLTGELDFAEALRETGIENLKMISTGPVPPNPSELLASQRMEEVIKQAEQEADMVILDTPPVVAVTDTPILATKIDGVILVVASHETEEGMLLKAKDRLDKVNANVLGTVLNKYPVDKAERYDSYYYYYGGDSVSK